MGSIIGIVLLIVIGLILLLLCIVGTWKKVPADKAAIVTGLGEAKVVTGGGTIVIPLLQRIDYITLENISFEVGMRNTLTSDAVPIDADGVVVVKIKNDEAMIRSAVEQFNCGDSDETKQHIMETSRDVCEGRLREIIADMTAEQLYKDRKTFKERVEEVAALQLSELGLELKSFTIKGIGDQNGYFDALSRPQIAAAKRDAEIAEAEAKRAALEKTSEAERAGEQARQEAEALKAEAIKDAEVKKLNYEAETQTQKAISDSAYEIQKHKTQMDVTNAEKDAQVLEQERLKNLAEAQIQVEIAAEQKKIELAQKSADRKEKELLETEVKPAQAAKEVAELNAEAEKIKAIKMAEAEAKAKELDAEAQAKFIQKQGEAEAEAIRRKGIAEAEALEKKAEALAKMNQAGMLQMVVEQLPEIARAIAEPLSKIDKITIIGGGDGASGGAVDVTRMTLGSLQALTEGMKETIGFDLNEVMKANTFEGKTTKNYNFDVKNLPVKETEEVIDLLKEPISDNEELVIAAEVLEEAVAEEVLEEAAAEDICAEEPEDKPEMPAERPLNPAKGENAFNPFNHPPRRPNMPPPLRHVPFPGENLRKENE